MSVKKMIHRLETKDTLKRLTEEVKQYFLHGKRTNFLVQSEEFLKISDTYFIKRTASRETTIYEHFSRDISQLNLEEVVPLEHDIIDELNRVICAVTDYWYLFKVCIYTIEENDSLM